MAMPKAFGSIPIGQGVKKIAKPRFNRDPEMLLSFIQTVEVRRYHKKAEMLAGPGLLNFFMRKALYKRLNRLLDRRKVELEVYGERLKDPVPRSRLDGPGGAATDFIDYRGPAPGGSSSRTPLLGGGGGSSSSGGGGFFSKVRAVMRARIVFKFYKDAGGDKLDIEWHWHDDDKK